MLELAHINRYGLGLLRQELVALGVKITREPYARALHKNTEIKWVASDYGQTIEDFCDVVLMPVVRRLAQTVKAEAGRRDVSFYKIEAEGVKGLIGWARHEFGDIEMTCSRVKHSDVEVLRFDIGFGVSDVEPPASPVNDGPAIDIYSAKPPILLPFAYRLRAELDKLQVRVAFDDAVHKVMSSDGLEYSQFNVTEDNPAALAKAIHDRCGKLVTFARLMTPRRGVQYCAECLSGDVYVREIVCYLVQTDELIQRWDVIVKTG